MYSNLNDYQNRPYIHRLLHMNLIVITANTQHIKRKEYKHKLKKVIRSQGKRANEERNKTALQKQPQNN